MYIQTKCNKIVTMLFRMGNWNWNVNGATLLYHYLSPRCLALVVDEPRITGKHLHFMSADWFELIYSAVEQAISKELYEFD